MTERNLKVVLGSRPEGKPTVDNFRVEEGPLPVAAEGQVLVRNQWLSIDPYMRGRMMDIRTYAEPVALGDVMVGDTAGVVVASRHPDFAPGDPVAAYLGWQRFGVAEGGALRRVDPRIPLSVSLGAAGMPGVTAWVGLLDLCQPKAGETVVVSAASGGVGSVAGQLARIAGCRVVGIAGGADKCRHVTEALGFDACLDYRAEDFRQQLKAAVPKGIDCIFDNVGGPVLEALIGRINPFARVTLCGAISEVDNPSPTGLRRLLPLIVNRVKLQGFIVGDHLERWPVAIADLSGHVAAGRIRYHETLAEGLEAAPQALLDLLAGRSLGKQLVRIP
ncbi:NADP-dependent oxidoreductase [Zoogloea sp.]|uniref:NADP-dependent oxidoreductase n=1 Tax=Zoogloea sp. TaxID=49181 RepID=UPI00261986CF|nr:NADP-dependent oxidoreductase [Zoogloea sp.]MDD3352098.1 NADP-dependent oxidoreductase [Zoogloea sp.]